LLFFFGGGGHDLNDSPPGSAPSQPTVSRIVKDISLRIAKNLRTWVKFPQADQVSKYFKRKFYELARFPGVIMAMNCTLIYQLAVQLVKMPKYSITEKDGCPLMFS